MADVLTKKQRSYCMSQIKGTGTKPEVKLRKTLWQMGVRYRVKNSLPGKPDLVIKKKKIAVFVDGCFWHRCPEHYNLPKGNRKFWEKKLSTNVKRDKQVNQILEDLGWNVIRIWEHEIKEDVFKTASRIVRD